MLNDLRFAGRMLRKRRGLTAVAALTLALGVGATTAVFSIVDAVLLRPLPYRDPDRLVAVWDHGLREKGMEKIFVPYADYEEWSRSARSFESVAAATWAYSPTRILTGRGPAKQVLAVPVSATFFHTLGVAAVLGRTFTPGDERNGCEVVLAHSFWTSILGADPGIAGRSLTLDQRTCTVAGVMPSGFAFYPPATEMWPLLGPDFRQAGENAIVGIFGRLKPGITHEQAQAELTALHRAAHPSGFFHDFEPRVYELHGEFTFLASRTLRITLMVAFSAVLLVLLIAALNVANLLLARMAERQREFAVRAALGCGRARLIRQMLAESLLLSAIGTLLGVGLAVAAVRYFRSASPIEVTAGADVNINLPVLLFTIAVAMATTLIFGLLPALSASRMELTEQLKAVGRGAVSGALRRRMAAAVIAVEMGLSFVLLAGAGLLLRSALRMGSEPLGFDPNHLLTTGTTLPQRKYGDPLQRVRFFDALLDRLNGIGGVTGAALTSSMPPYAVNGGLEPLEIGGRPAPANLERHDVGVNLASPRFFEVLGVRLYRGRDFTAADRPGAPPVAIISEALAREYFPDADPIGQQIRIAPSPSEQKPWLTVVGVVADLKHPELMNEMSWAETPVVYESFFQAAPDTMRIAVRGAAADSRIEREVQQQVSALEGSVPVNPVEPVSTAIAKTLAYPRFRAVVLGFFAVTALLLSSVGLSGVLFQVVAQRTSEFGIRKALGAQQSDLLLLVAHQGGIPVAIGMAAGLACTFLFSRVLTALLYGISPADPEVLVLISVVFAGIAVAAMALPARRAALVDPMTALREE